jgi:hypothetical protein
MTELELQELCAEWQKRLGLSYWKITANFARHYEFDDDSEAKATYIMGQEKAIIKVMSPNDYNSLYPQDIEESLVHELIHILYAPLAPDGGFSGIQQTFEEQFINRTASALVTLKRELPVLVVN